MALHLIIPQVDFFKSVCIRTECLLTIISDEGLAENCDLARGTSRFASEYVHQVQLLERRPLFSSR